MEENLTRSSQNSLFSWFRKARTEMMEKENCGEEKGTAYYPKHTTLSFRRGGGNVMAWECMIVNRIRSLVLTDDVPAERSNRKKSKVIPVTLCSG